MATSNVTSRGAIQQRRPPGPRTNPWRQIFMMLIGRGYEAENFLQTLQEWFDEHGDVVGVTFLQQKMAFIRHPDDIYDLVLRKASSFHKGPDYKNEKWGLASFLGNGLLISDGEFWKRQRKLVQPALHARRIENYADTMVAYTERMLTGWRDGQTLQMDEAMSALTMQIVAKSLFNEDVSADVERVAQAMETLQDVATHPSLWPEWLPLPRHQRKRKAVRDLDEIVYGFIADWRQEKVDRGDLLSMLMLAVDDEGSGMSDKQGRDELVTLLLAGHETTANALNWIFYLLAQNGDAEAALHEEVDRVLDGRTPTLADLENLRYTKAVVEESLRLYPPAWSFGRQAIEPVTIGGYDFEEGTVISVITYAVHRDPRWWPDPDQFRPERFLHEDPDRPKYAYIPFGGGPRICIGNHFAMMEAQLILATIAQRFRLRLLPGQTVTPEPLITLVPGDGLRMTIVEREPDVERVVSNE